MEFFSEDYLMHHGILGQKWGVRRYQNRRGKLTFIGKKRLEEAKHNRMIEAGEIPKGTKLYRVTLDKHDPAFSNRKYFSLNKYDNASWQDMYAQRRSDMGSNKKLYSIAYKTTKDIRIANSDVLTDIGVKLLKEDPKAWAKEVTKVKRETGYTDYQIPTMDRYLTLTIALGHPTGNRVMKELQAAGYDALEDSLGRDVSINPVILIDPDNTTKRTLGTLKY